MAHSLSRVGDPFDVDSFSYIFACTSLRTVLMLIFFQSSFNFPLVMWLSCCLFAWNAVWFNSCESGVNNNDNFGDIRVAAFASTRPDGGE